MERTTRVSYKLRYMRKDTASPRPCSAFLAEVIGEGHRVLPRLDKKVCSLSVRIRGRDTSGRCEFSIALSGCTCVVQ